MIVEFFSISYRHEKRIGHSEEGARLLESTLDGYDMYLLLSFIHILNIFRLSKRGAQCGYRNQWISSFETINFERILLNIGSGNLDAASGIWTADVKGEGCHFQPVFLIFAR